MSMRKYILTALAAILCTAAFAAEDIVLSNKHVSLTFDGGKTFSFKEYKALGKNMLPAGGSTAHPWAITLLGPRGETPELQPRFSWYDGGVVETSAGTVSATFTWRIVLESQDIWKAQMKVTLGEESELPEWDFSLELPEGWVLTDLEFPRITVAAPEGSKAILPISYGGEYDITTSGQLQIKYPSCSGTMELVMMYNGPQTAYFAALDREGSRKNLILKNEGRTVTFIQSVPASYGWTSGGRFELPWATVLGFNGEGWEATALKWYRPFTFTTEWGAKTLNERKITPWIKNADVWLRPADATESMLENTKKAIALYGKGTGLHWYYWHGHPFDSYYPEYFPTQPGFKEMVKECQKMGAFVTPYINGRLWDSATDSYRDLNGKDASCRKTDGTLYTEVYSSKVLNTVTCPSSPIWQNVLRDVNSRILKELKTDGVYMDQIGCAISQPCYNPEHNHDLGGGSWWPRAYRELLTGMRKDIYGKNHAMTTEENAECYIDLFDMMLTVNSPHASYMKMVPLFPLIYSDRAIVSGFTYIPWKLNDGSMNYITMMSLLWGAQLGWVNPELLMRAENEREAMFLKTLGDFRKGCHDLFVGGRFLGEFIPGGDNETVSIPNYWTTPVVHGAKWCDKDGKEATILVNMSAKDRTVTLPDGSQATVGGYNAVRL